MADYTYGTCTLLDQAEPPQIQYQTKFDSCSDPRFFIIATRLFAVMIALQDLWIGFCPSSLMRTPDMETRRQT